MMQVILMLEIPADWEGDHSHISLLEWEANRHLQVSFLQDLEVEADQWTRSLQD